MPPKGYRSVNVPDIWWRRIGNLIEQFPDHYTMKLIDRESKFIIKAIIEKITRDEADLKAGTSDEVGHGAVTDFRTEFP